MFQLSLSDNEEGVDKENLNTLNIAEYLPDSFQASKDDKDTNQAGSVADLNNASDDEDFGKKKPRMQDLEHDLQIDEEEEHTKASKDFKGREKSTASEDLWMKVNMETSDTDITEKLFSKKNIEKVNSDSFASESDDDKITKKKKKKKKSKMDSGLTEEEMEKTKKKKSVLSDSDDAALSCSDDELLQDTELALHALVNKGNSVAGVSVVGNNDDDSSDGSVGLPDDMYVVRDKEDRDAVKKMKKVKKLIDGDVDIENWEKKDRGEHDPKTWEEGKKKGGKDLMQELRSEQQRLLRETDFKLPRHEPKPLLLENCLAKIPKLSAMKPKAEVTKEENVFRPKLTSKNDNFFLSKDLGNFMDRFKKHLSFTPKTAEGNTKPQKPITKAGHAVIFNHAPNSVLIKKQVQAKLQEQILAAKVENRKEKEKEHQMDHEQMSAEDEALKRMLDLEDMDEDNETEEEEEEEVGTVKKKKRKKKIAVQDEDSNDVPDEEEVEEEIEEEIEEKEDEDEMINRRAEKILQGEDVTSSEEEEVKERNYHTDTDSDLLASADEVDVAELPPDSAEEDVMQPSRYSLRRLTRYIRKKRVAHQSRRVAVELGDESEEEGDLEKEKMGKARKRIERLLAKRKKMKERQREELKKRRGLEEKREEMMKIARLAEINAAEIEKLRKESKPKDKAPSTTLRSLDKPWLTDEDVPTCTGHSAQRPKRRTDAELEARAARVLQGEDLSSSSSDEDVAERNYHTDTDSDLLASADEVDVAELPPDSADEENVLLGSRYSLRRLTRYCRKKRIKRNHQNPAAADEEKEEKAKRKLAQLLAQREALRQKWLENKEKRKEGKRALLACSNSADLFGSMMSSSRNVTSMSNSIIAEDSQPYSYNNQTFDIDDAEMNLIEESQVDTVTRPDFLQPDEDAVFFNTQGLIQTCKPQAGIAALDNDESEEEDLLDICTGVFSGGFSGGARGVDGGGVTLGDFSLRLSQGAISPDSSLTKTSGKTSAPRTGLSQTPLARFSKVKLLPDSQTPLAHFSKVKLLPDSQTPLAHFSKVKLLPDDLIQEDSVDGFGSDEGEVSEYVQLSKRRLMTDFMDEEAEKSGEEHSSDEEDNELDEYDKSMLAKESEIPSDEEELANQLAGQYQDQLALDEKNALRKLKERFIDTENEGFFRTKKFFTDEANLEKFSPNLGLGEEEDVVMSVEEYRVEMAKRTETMEKNQFVQEKKKKEMGQENIDEDSQALLDSLHDVTDSHSRAIAPHQPQCGSFLKHKSGTLSKLSSITAASLKTDGLATKSYVFQSVSPRNPKRSRASFLGQTQGSSSQKRQKNTTTTEKSIFSVINDT